MDRMQNNSNQPANDKNNTDGSKLRAYIEDPDKMIKLLGLDKYPPSYPMKLDDVSLALSGFYALSSDIQEQFRKSWPRIVSLREVQHLAQLKLLPTVPYTRHHVTYMEVVRDVVRNGGFRATKKQVENMWYILKKLQEEPEPSVANIQTQEVIKKDDNVGNKLKVLRKMLTESSTTKKKAPSVQPEVHAKFPSKKAHVREESSHRQIQLPLS